MDGIRRTDSGAQGAGNTIVGTGQPRDWSGHFQAPDGTNDDAFAAARAAFLIH